MWNLQKAELRETESRMWLPGDRYEKNWEVSVERYKLPVVRQISSGDLMYSMVIIINNNVLYS